MTFDKDVKELVILRLRSVPSDIIISVGNFGEFTGEQLIKEVGKGSEIGNAIIRKHLLFIRTMPTLSKRIADYSETVEV